MIITLCGSARFEPWFHAWNEALSLAGHCVFGIASYPSMWAGKKDWYTPQQKIVLDAVHKDKISASDAILVLNVFAYIGDSVLAEIAFARNFGRQTYFLESWGKGCGIGGNHFQSMQAARDKFNVPRGYVSPIDTSESRDNISTWSTALLGEGSAYRSALVSVLDARLSPLKGLPVGQ